MTGKFAAMILMLLTAACATQQQTASLECGVAGAGLGFLACKLAGGSDATCAAVGGVAAAGGGVLCYSLSSNLEKHRKELAGHENNLDARIAYVKAVNEDSARYNTGMKKDLVAITQHTDTVVQQIGQKTIDQQTLAKERSKLDTDLKNANDSIAAQEKSINLMRKLQADNNLQDPRLAQELRDQQMLLEQTRQQTAALASQRQRI
ncbi:hypothetical protein [Paraburkholderia sp. GAS42]|jgi:hypothetical protein|uniref:hypothetical protein n=1 Tax=Paraburkholderia sp. GAS42 TaxID=3035135 RepID=UPI003D1DCABC